MTIHFRLSLLLALVAPAWSPRASAAQQAELALEFALDSVLSLPVSTVSKYEQKQTEAPAFVSIVTRDEIRRFGYRTMEEVLQHQVGFYVGNDREYSDAGFRGFGRPGHYNNKLLLLVDGHSLNDSYSGGTRLGSAMPIDLDAVERIEIVRGPGSAVYGARAMLAVVNLVTLKGRDVDGLEVTAGMGTPQSVGGSVRYGRVLGVDGDLAVAASWSSDDGEDIYYPELDSPALNNGVAENLDWDRLWQGLVTLRHGDFSFQGVVAQRTKGIPTGAYRIAFNHPDARVRDRSVFAEARFAREFSSTAELTVRGYVDSHDNDGIYPFGTSEVVESNVDARSAGAEATVRWDPALSQRVVLGVEAQRIFTANHVVSRDTGAEPTGNHPYTILSAFIHEEFQITQDLALTLGIRRDQYSTRGTATTPRAALVYHPRSATTLKVLFGEAFRAPNTLEMYVNQPAAALLSNPDLEPEKIRSFEVVWEERLGPVATTATAYHNEIRDLIDLVEIAAPDSLAHWGRLAFEQQNIDNARSVGFEFEARMALPFGILARSGYAFSQATDRSTGDVLVNAPRHQLRLSASAGSVARGTLAAALVAESGRRTLYGTDTDGMSVVDVTATSRRYLDRLTVQLRVRNLFDVNYEAPGGFQHVQSAIPQPGRRVTLRADFGW